MKVDVEDQDKHLITSMLCYDNRERFVLTQILEHPSLQTSPQDEEKYISLVKSVLEKNKRAISYY